jgi:hypothetical protein
MSQPDQNPKPTRLHWTVVSVALVILGLLIVIPAGLCTAILGGSILASSLPMGDFSAIFIVMLYGGVPIAAGISLIMAGLRARRRS